MILVLVAGALLLSLAAAQAVTLTVNSDADAGGTCPGADCTLRQAILAAASGDTIDFSAGITTINLTSAELLIEKSLTINGPGADLLSVQRSTADGTPAFRIFKTQGTSPADHFFVTIRGLTIANGRAVGSGGILNANAGYGGSFGLTVTGCTIAGNYSEIDFSGFGGSGGGIGNGGTVTVTNSTISGNTANRSGGGIYNSGMVTVTNSTISGNTANGTDSSSGGGGIYNQSSGLTVTGCTIFGNFAQGGGGGIHNSVGYEADARNTIIAKNTASTGAPDINGPLDSQGFNFIGNNAGAAITPQPTDQIGTAGSPIDPLLGPLQNNGGRTQTQALLFGSTAIDKGHSSDSNSDQRDFTRPVDDPAIPNATGGDGADIGAFEVQATGTVLVGNGAFDFSPQSIPIQRGGTVQWSWSSSGHSSTSGTPGSPSGLWDSGVLVQGATFSHTFINAGSFPYYCTVHGSCCGMTGMVTVAKANQTITVGALADKTYGDPPFDLHASASSGLPVSFQIVSGPASVSGNTVTINGGGIVTVRALQAGDSDYNAATPIDQSFTVAKANQAITFGALADKTYGDPAFNVSASASSGLPVTLSIVSGPATISGNTITLTGPGMVTVRAVQSGSSNYNAAPSVDQSFSVAKASPLVSVSSTPNPSETGENVIFTAVVSVSAGTSTGTVQFKDNGANLGSPQPLNAMSSASYSASSLTPGTHVITAEYSGDSNVTNATGTLAGGHVVNVASTLANIATRLDVGTFDNVLIAGFIIQGTAPKKVAIRAIGPSLTQHGVPNALANPQLELHDDTGTIGLNDNWQTAQVGGVIPGDQTQEIQDSGLAPTDGLESAMIATLSPGSYTAVVRGVGDTIGVGLAEVYDLSERGSPARIANISTRGLVQPDDKAMIGGIIIIKQPTKVVIRAIGPSLRRTGISNALSNPQLELHDSTRTIATNDNWQTTQVGGVITSDQTAELLDTHLAPDDPAESAMIVTLQPGSYSAVVRGVNATSGVGLVEVYALQ